MNAISRLPLLGSLLSAIRRPRRRPTASELMAMDSVKFEEFVRTTGLEGRVTASLRKHENGAP